MKYTYKELLDYAHKLMQESGIRQYCQETCKGSCCGNCRGMEETLCSHKLPCALFTCFDVKRALQEIVPEADIDSLWATSNAGLLWSAAKVIRKRLKGQNAFFAPYRIEDMKRVRIKASLPYFTEADLKRMRRFFDICREKGAIDREALMEGGNQ